MPLILVITLYIIISTFILANERKLRLKIFCFLSLGMYLKLFLLGHEFNLFELFMISVIFLFSRIRKEKNKRNELVVILCFIYFVMFPIASIIQSYR